MSSSENIININPIDLKFYDNLEEICNSLNSSLMKFMENIFLN
jgi:hypothetical protein